MKSFLWAAVAATALVSAGCSFDLSLPEKPQRGKVIGSIDTAGHLPLGNNTVVLVSEDGAKSTQTTDAAGAYAFDDLQPGSFFIELKLPGFAPLARPNIRVKPGQTVELETLTPLWLQNTTSAATLSGKVIVEGNAGSVLGGTVDFLLEPVEQQVARATLGADGTFVVQLSPGSYSVAAKHPSYVTGIVKGVVLAEAEKKDISASPIVMQLNPATLVGTVAREVDGLAAVPAQGALVTLDNGANSNTLDGGFQIGGLADGTRTVTVTLDGYHDNASHLVQLKPGLTTTMEPVQLSLDRGRIRGTVSLSDGAPATDVTVSVVGTPYSAIVSPSTATPGTGTFQLENVPVGTYSVSATKARYSSALKTAVAVTYQGTADTGQMNLVLLTGDFEIDDGSTASVAGYVNKANVTLKLSNVGQATRYRASEDQSFAGVSFAAIPGTSIPFTLSAGDGLKTVYLQYEDVNGNASPVFTASAVLDTTAPSAPSVSINGGAAFTRVVSPFTLTLTATEGTSSGPPVSGLSTVTIGESLDGSGNVVGTPQAYLRDIPFARTGSTNGTVTLYVQFTDRAGNVSQVAQASTVLDTVSPTGNISISPGANAAPNFTNSGSVTLNETFGAEPNGGSVMIRLSNTPGGVASATPLPAQAQTSWLLDTSTEGSKTVYAQLVDSAGNTSAVLSANITYDKTPPTQASVALSGVTSPLNVSAVPLTVAAQDPSGLAALPLTLSEDPLFNGATAVAMPSGATTFTLSAGDGDKRIYARFRDVAGNETIVSRLVTLDQTAPSGSFVVQGTLADGTPSTELTATATVTLKVTQVGATAYFAGDETTTTCPASGYGAIAQSVSYALTGTASPRQIRLCLRDAAGNVTGPLSGQIALDSDAPSGCALDIAGARPDGRPAPSGFTATSTVTATVSGCSEVPAQMVLTAGAVTCTAAGLSWAPFTPSQSFTLSGGDGQKTLRTCVKDAAGNIATLNPTDIKLDTTPPTPVSVSVQGSAVTASSSVTLLLNATDGSGLDPAEAVTASEDVHFAGATPIAMPGNGQLPFTLSAVDGERAIYVRYRDLAGNEAFAQTKATRDTSAPTGSFAIVGALADGTASSTLTSSATITLAVTSSGATEYVKGGATMTTCPSTGWQTLPASGQISATLSVASGPEEIRLCLRDAALNTAGPLSQTISRDSAAPTGCALALQGKKKDGSAAPATLTANPDIAAAVSGCGGGPTEMFLSTGTVTCSATASVGWVPFSAVSTVSLGTGDGTRTVSGCVRDAARNVSAISPANITLDTTAPAGVNATPSATSSTTTAITVTVTGTDSSGLDATSGVTISENAFFTAVGTVTSAMPGNGQVSYTLSSGDGVKQLYVRVRDLVGNEAFTDAVVTLDQTAPQGSFIVQGTLADGTVSNELTSTASVTLKITQVGATQYFAGDENTTACPSSGYAGIASSVPFTLTGTASPRQVRLCLKDGAGNVTGPLSGQIALDADAPTGCSLVLAGARPDGRPAPSGYTATPTITTTISGCGEVPAAMYLTASAVTCTTAGLQWTPFAPSQSFALTGGDGQKTLRACVKDAAGNISALSPTNITLDTAAPAPVSVSVQGSATTAANSVTLLLSATDNSGLHATEAVTASEDVHFSGATPVAMPGNGQLTFNLSPVDGEHTIFVRYRDLAGNDAFSQAKVTRDTSAAPGSFYIAGTLADGTTSATLTSSSTVALVVTSAGAAEYVVGSSAMTVCPSTGWQTLPSNGLVSATLSVSSGAEEIRLCLRDAALNTTGPLSSTITLDSTAPTSCALSLSGKKKDGTAAPATFTANADVTTGVSGCVGGPTEMFLSTGSVTCSATASLAWQPFSAVSQISLGSGDGTRTVSGCVRDAAHNVGPISSANITLDTTAPSGITAAPSALVTTATGITVTVNAVDSSGLDPASGITISENAFFTAVGTVTTALPGNGQISYTLSSGDGVKQLYVRARDRVGNEGFTDAVVTLDQTAPQGSFVVEGTLADGTPSTELTFTSNVTLKITQVGATDYFAGNESTVTCPTSGYTTVSSSISHVLSGTASPRQVRLCLKDGAGNITGPLSGQIALDAAAPTGCSLVLTGARPDGRPAPAGFTAASAITASISGCNEVPASMYVTAGAVTCTAAGLSWTPFSPSSAFNLGGGDGLKTLRACVKDAAGNITTLGATDITLDTAAPAPVSATVQGSSVTSGSSVTLLLSATDTYGLDPSEAVTASEDVYFTGATPVAMPGNGQLTFNLSNTEGERTVFVRFRDLAGNEAFAQVRATRDTTPPDGSFVIVGALADGTSSTTLTSSAAVTLQVTSADATEYLVGPSTMGSCPATGWTAMPSNHQIAANLTVANGVEELRLCLRDGTLNAGAPLSASITRDSSPPTGCALALSGKKKNGTAAPAGLTADEDATATISACAGSPVEIYLATGTVTCSPTAPFPWEAFGTSKTVQLGAGDGSKTVTGCVRDAARNVLAIPQSAITLDTTAPSSITVSSSATLTSSNAVTLTLNAFDVNGLDPTSAVTISENAFFTAAGTVTSSLPGNGQVGYTLSSGDGAKQLYVRIRDVVGNDGFADTVVTLDQTPPSGSFTVTGALADGFPSTEVTTTNAVNVQVVQSGAVSYVLGSESLATCPSTAGLYTALPAGVISHTMTSATNPREVRLCLRDSAGNLAGPYSKTIRFDNAGPTGCALQLAGNRRSGGTSTVSTYDQNIQATVTGCAETPAEAAVFLGGSPNCTQAMAWVPFSNLSQLQLTSTEGPQNVVACLRDAARNLSGLGPATIRLDKTPPSVTSFTVGSGAFTTSGTVNVTVAATDVGGLTAADSLTVAENTAFSIAPVVGPQAFGASPATVSFALSTGNGLKTVYGRVRDAAGNETIVSGTITRDSAPPSVSFVLQGVLADNSPSQVYSVSSSVNALVTSPDDATKWALALSSTTCPTAAAFAALPAGSPSSIPVNIPASAGPQTVYLCFQDAAGNIGGPSSASITYDATGPSGCAFTLSGFQADGTTASLVTGKTATNTIRATLSGCADTVEFFLVNGNLGCATSATLPWSSYVSGNPVTHVLAGVEGGNTVSGCVRDSARRTLDVAPKSLTLDTTEPSVFEISLNNGDEYINIATPKLPDGGVTVAVTGTASGATEWALSTDNGAYGTFGGFSNGSPVPLPLTGDGPHKVSAVFRDDLWNTTAQPVSAFIKVDTVKPSVVSAGVTVQNQNLAGYIRTTDVVVAATRPSDTDLDSIQIGEGVAASACGSGDVGAAPLPLLNTYQVSVGSSQNQKRVCARWLDRAGNPSDFVTALTTLDSIPPPTPRMLTEDAILGAAAGTNFMAQIQNAPVADHKAWQYGGGALVPDWSNVTPVTAGAALNFTFPLITPTAAQVDGRLNVLRIHEVDLADNVSDPAFVNVVLDNIPPRPPTVNLSWVDNSNGNSTLYWVPATDAGTNANFLVYYASAQGDSDAGVPIKYNGTFAAQGPSPISVDGTKNALTLSNLPNGSATFTTVRALDRAGNMSGPATGFEVPLQPGVVAPDLMQTFQLFNGAAAPVNPLQSRIEKIVVNEDMAYVLGTANGACGWVVLQAVSLERIDSPLGRSGPQTPAFNLFLGAPVSIAEPSQCPASQADIEIEGRYLYLTAASKVRIYQLDDVWNPALVTTLDFANAASVGFANSTSVQIATVKGQNLFVNGTTSPNGILYHVDLSTLFDGNSATFPTLSSIKGSTNASALNPPGLVWSRNRLLTGAKQSTQLSRAWDLTAVLDGNTGTNLSTSDQLGGGAVAVGHWGHARGTPEQSGNLMVSLDPAGMVVSDIKDLWTSTNNYVRTVGSAAYGGNANVVVLGGQALFADSTNFGLRTYDLGDPTSPVNSGLWRFLHDTAVLPRQPHAVAAWGNYLLMGDTVGVLRVLEVAKPRGMRLIGESQGVGPSIEVGPGLVYSSSGAVHDLFVPANPAILGVQPEFAGTNTNPVGRCVYDGVRVDDVEVTSFFRSDGFFGGGGYLKFTPLDDQVDRGALSPGFSPTYLPYFDSSIHPTAVELYGNYLIVAETRSTGLWLEVYNAQKLRSGSPSRTLTLSDRVAQYQFGTGGSSSTFLSLTIHHGQALISSSDGILYFVDIRPLLDDSNTPTMADLNQHQDPGNPAVLNNGMINQIYQPGAGSPVALTGLMDIVVRGLEVYFVINEGGATPARGGLYAMDMTDLFDNDPTSWPGTTASADIYIKIPHAHSFDVRGNYAMVTQFSTSSFTLGEVLGVLTYDLSNFGSPVPLSTYPLRRSRVDCNNVGDASHMMRSTTLIKGSRAYIAHDNFLNVIELE